MATSQVGQQSFVIPAPTVKILHDIKDLKYGDQYVIMPDGVDYQSPETLFGAGKEIERLQLLIEKKFKKKKKNVTDKN